jgi:glutamate-1-semialdehyde 2,1-aminomutase
MRRGQKLYKKAKKIIPGGTMLLSKRPEMFLPENWPAYFKKASGCKIIDLDDKEYIDMSLMGVGTNILGYGHPDVDKAVKSVISNGNMSTFNCYEEVGLAEKLIDLHPWSDMVRFARTGGEANSIAVRIARAISGKDNIAICGYHGWHDWYLAANLNEKDSLKNHLLSGLTPNGVPKNLKDSIYTFNYNNIEELEKLIAKKDIGIIKMEVSRSMEPKDDFLKKVRDLANSKNIILIFDECTSGFRETYGGLHKKYNVYPDIAIFGKSLGNGYAITAVVGKSEIMQGAQKSFISSTFWTERIGPAAALATLDIMGKEQSWDIITSMGKTITSNWEDLATLYSLKIKTFGLPSLTSFLIDSENWLAYKTYLTQEMLKRGFLATNSVYVSIAHKKNHIDKYFFELDKIFKKIKSFEDGENVYDKLDGPVCQTGFKRLN